MSEVPFRILSLDGGGVRGLFPAAFLAHIEEYTGERLIDHFQLVVGTSTGSIIALGLAAGIPATEIHALYQRHGRTIFSKPHPLRGLLGTKYSNRNLVAAIKSILGEATLNDLKVPVCIPSYELASGVPRVFKDNHHPDLHWGGDQLLWKVATASSAAPTYFPAVQLEEADSHVDGGIWANNPVLVGIAEAVRYFEQPLESISILSVSTGSSPMRFRHAQVKSRGILRWVWKAQILTLVLQAQSQSADRTARMLIPPERYLRVDLDLPSAVSLDEYIPNSTLIERGAQAGREYKTEIEHRFLLKASSSSTDKR